MTTSVQMARAVAVATRQAVERAAQAVAALQHPEGFWWAELTADTTLESDFILLQLWLHPPVDGVWNPPKPERIQRAADSILKRQLEDGGFGIYPGGPADVSATVKAYCALKLAGISPQDSRLARARERILALGGVQAANSYVKLNLSLFGLYPRDAVPSVPPEMMWLPGKFIYQMSSWTRAIVIPLSVIQASVASRPVPRGFDLKELFLEGAPLGFSRDDSLLSWRNFFLACDWLLKHWERHGPKCLREAAIRRARSWMREHARHSDGLGAIFPAMMYHVMALDAVGVPASDPERQEAERQFMRLLADDSDRFFFQPCFSPVWDTAIAMHALAESGVAPRSLLLRGAAWLEAREIRRTGDWSIKRPGVEPSGWCFEFANDFYPDVDDTAQVLLALAKTKLTAGCRRRALAWLQGMQSSDGGWAAFDADNHWSFLNHIPFADHNAMLDPSCPDITGRTLEALVVCGVDPAERSVRRGVEYLIRSQRPDGSWFGRWGVAYIYGTYLALRGLRAAGEDLREAYILRAGEWLRSIQNADGGWGESCASYDQGAFVPAKSTASQTAWAILGLIASGDTTSLSVQKGVDYLLETQNSDGGWDEDAATGTGFPGVFYLTYHLYRNAFPLLALSEYRKVQKEVRT